MQIRKKIPFIMIILICVPLVILALIIYVYSSRTLVVKSKDNISQLVAAEGRALEGLIAAKKYQVQVLASDERIINLLESPEQKDNVIFRQKAAKAERLIKQAVLEEEDCCGIYVINAKGEIMARSNGSSKDCQAVQYEMFEKVLGGESIFKNMVICPEDENYTINMTVPVKNRRGKVVGGVCKAVYNTSFSEFVKGIKINETGFAYILDDEACIVAHPNELKVGSVSQDKAIASMTGAGDSLQKKGKSIVESKEDGALKYTAFYQLPDIGWTIAVSQNASEVQQQAVTEFGMIIAMTLVLIGILMIAAVRLSKRITIPVDKLVGVMQKVAKGRLDEYCEYNADDEFGSLAKHYNDMIRSLNESRKEREDMLGELTTTQEELRLNLKALMESKEALGISEARYRATLDDIEETIWEYDTAAEKILVTGKWKGFIEKEGQIAVGDALENIADENFIEEFKEVLERCARGEVMIFSKELSVQSTEGETVWVLCKGKAVLDGEGEIVKIRGVITDITNYKVSEERVKQLAYFDVLTGCLNKQAFMKQMKEEIGRSQKGAKAALLFVDLDDFKKINDTLGHDVGDKLLNFVAGKMKRVIGKESLMSRFGGDEFVVYKQAVQQLEEIEALAHSILEIFKEKIMINEHVIHITCSIGIALYPLDGTNSEVLLKNADTAMYKAKEQGKNSYSFYAEDMSRTLARKLMIEDVLREAIGEGKGLYLQYQPIVEMESGKTIGAEALVRLKSEEAGFISPGEFIPVAEETGLIIEVGDWVMETALRLLSYYHKMGYDEFSISINVSALQMRQKDFMSKLKQCVRRHNVPPECIKLEVTETVLMQNLEETRCIFDEIKKSGIKLALDDFGTGYSSLNYLRNIPLDILKIDKSFIDELTSSRQLSEIVDSIINMAHILDIDVVAEGVESEEQRELLRQKGCDLIQGYVFSKPLMGEELNRRLQGEKIS